MSDINLEKIDDFRWRIPRSYKPGMRVPGIIYADEKLLKDIRQDKAMEQVANVAFLPGIVKAERKRLSEQLRAIGFTLPDSSSNFVFAEHQARKAKSIFDKLVQRNIYVRYWDLPGIENKLRISVGTREQNDTLLSALKEIAATV